MRGTLGIDLDAAHRMVFYDVAKMVIHAHAVDAVHLRRARVGLGGDVDDVGLDEARRGVESIHISRLKACLIFVFLDSISLFVVGKSGGEKRKLHRVFRRVERAFRATSGSRARRRRFRASLAMV